MTRIALRCLRPAELAVPAGDVVLGERLARDSAGHPGLAAAWLLALSRDGDLDLTDDLEAIARHGLPRQFLTLAAACGDVLPTRMAARTVGLSPEAMDDIVDRIDENWCVGGRGLGFADLHYTHPAFPHDPTYRTPRLLRAWLETRHLDVAAAAEHATPVFIDRLRSPTRAGTGILLSLMRTAGVEASASRHLRDLAWWAGATEEESLAELLVGEIARGSLRLPVLWDALEASDGRWPPYRRRALLLAYRRSESGPVETRPGLLAYISALVLRDAGEPHAALDEARRATSQLGPDGPDVPRFIGSLILTGQLQLQLSRPAEAEPPLEQALEAVSRLTGSAALETSIHESLTAAAVALDRPEEALRHARRASELATVAHGSVSTQRAELLARLAPLLRRCGAAGDARRTLEEALAISRALLDPRSPRLAAVMKMLADEIAADDAEGAAGLQQEAVEIEEEAFGVASERVRVGRSRLLDLLLQVDRGGDEHRAQLVRALDAERRAEEPDVHRRSVLLRRLADHDSAHGATEAARQSLVIGLRTEEERGDVAAQIEILKLLGDLDAARGSAGEAARHFERALRLQESSAGADDPGILDLLKVVADGHLAAGRHDLAIACLERAQTIEEGLYGRGDPRTAGNARYLAAVLRRLGRDEQAAIYETRA